MSIVIFVNNFKENIFVPFKVICMDWDEFLSLIKTTVIYVSNLPYYFYASDDNDDNYVHMFNDISSWLLNLKIFKWMFFL